MQNSYDFVDGPFNGQRKAFESGDFPMAADGGTYRLTGAGHSVGGSPMVYTALFWPDREAGDDGKAAAPIQVGDAFVLDSGNVGDCSSIKMDGAGIFAAMCVLDENHGGRHVASNGETIVEVWD